MNKEIRFRDLSNPLKVAIVAGWIYAVFFAVSFGSGVLQGLLG